mmetsp:Transcript_31127/g.85248  ORF Transcript_31127/g.85248 Transcript_31127/m.85248 type:complete len:462 (+) Transcript_31127:774-2159(+)
MKSSCRSVVWVARSLKISSTHSWTGLTKPNCSSMPGRTSWWTWLSSLILMNNACHAFSSTLPLAASKLVATTVVRASSLQLDACPPSAAGAWRWLATRFERLRQHRDALDSRPKRASSNAALSAMPLETRAFAARDLFRKDLVKVSAISAVLPSASSAASVALHWSARLPLPPWIQLLVAPVLEPSSSDAAPRALGGAGAAPPGTAKSGKALAAPLNVFKWPWAPRAVEPRLKAPSPGSACQPEAERPACGSVHTGSALSALAAATASKRSLTSSWSTCKKSCRCAGTKATKSPLTPGELQQMAEAHARRAWSTSCGDVHACNSSTSTARKRFSSAKRPPPTRLAPPCLSCRIMRATTSTSAITSSIEAPGAAVSTCTIRFPCTFDASQRSCDRTPRVREAESGSSEAAWPDLRKDVSVPVADAQAKFDRVAAKSCGSARDVICGKAALGRCARGRRRPRT